MSVCLSVRHAQSTPLGSETGGTGDFCLNHTLSIWLEMELTRNMFLKTSVCADYSQNPFNDK